ncbi:hypothetical protein JCM1393_27290 [Clostridium carnis]
MKSERLKVCVPDNLVVKTNTVFEKQYNNYHDLINRRIHEVFKEAIKDEDFIKIILFNNDFLNISPVETFLSFYSSRIPKLSERKLAFVNALFESLFKEVLGHKKYHNILSINYTKTKSEQY